MKSKDVYLQLIKLLNEKIAKQDVELTQKSRELLRYDNKSFLGDYSLFNETIGEKFKLYNRYYELISMNRSEGLFTLKILPDNPDNDSAS